MLAIHHLTHRYASATTDALKDVSLQINAGECIGLLGPNGAGKTTLMSLLAGLQSVQQGEILLDGVPFQQLSKAQRHQISLVPQDFAFYPLLSVWENLCFFASLYGIKDKGYLRQLLQQVDLIAHQHKLAKHLSGGLKRRLNFAIGLINRPKVIFLDEITVGIDPESRQFILESVQALSRQGVTVIYTSHYLQEIELLCQNLAVLHQGQLIYQGKVQDILQQHSKTGVMVQLEPAILEADLNVLNGKMMSQNWVAFDSQKIEPILTALSAKGYQIQSCQFGHQSLEAFYLDFLRQHSGAKC